MGDLGLWMPLFVFLFLPAVLACTALPGLKLRNLLLLAFSLVFYALGRSHLRVADVAQHFFGVVIAWAGNVSC